MKGRLLITVVFMMLTMGLAWAGVDSDDLQRADTTMLNEISVTAVKNQQMLWDSPVASTLTTRTELERMNAVTLKGISDVVPNFYIPDYGSRITSSIYVRGIGARMDQPSVGFIVDNVAILNKDAYDFDVDDIAQAEVLRGPQSTLYGRNTMGGLINISTLSPMRYQGWRMSLTGATANRYRIGVGWYGKLCEDMGLSATASMSWQGGFFENKYNGKKLDKERNGAARIKYVWNIDSNWMLQNTFSTSVLRQGGYPYAYLPTNEICYNDTCFYRRFTLTDGLSLRGNFDSFIMSVIASVQYINDNMTLDQDFLPESYFTLTQKKRDLGFTFDATMRDHRVADDAYHWIAGLFGFYKHLDMNSPVTFKDVGIAELIESHRNEVNPNYPIRWDTREFPLNSEFVIPNYGVALYHESKLNLGNWHLSAGLRFDFERTEMEYHSFCNTDYTVYTTNAAGEPDGVFRKVNIDIDDRNKLHRQYLNVMPKIGVVYDLPLNNSNLYASITRGFKAGGFNTQMFSDVLQQRLMILMGIGASYDVNDIVGYKPEKSWNYELGCHLQIVRNKLSVDGALFFIDCRDQQLTMFPDGTTTGRIMTNAGRTHSFGGELSVAYNIGQGFAMNFSYGYTHARFKEFFDGINNYAGKALPYVPENTLFVQGLYTRQIGNKILKRLEIDVNLRATGKIYWNEQNSRRQNFYGLLGASLTACFDKLQIELWGRNLTNTHYNTFYFLSMGNEFLQRGQPANGGITLRFCL